MLMKDNQYVNGKIDAVQVQSTSVFWWLIVGI